jgi:hypothetical protein
LLAWNRLQSLKKEIRVAGKKNVDKACYCDEDEHTGSHPADSLFLDHAPGAGG